MRTITTILTFTILCTGLLAQPKIYEWRGADRNGKYPDRNLLKSWPAEGPAELFTVAGLGNGYGSPVFTEEHFYITGEIDTVTYLYCYTLDGNRVWKSKLGTEWMKSYPGGRDAPTVVDNRIYVGTGIGDIYCVNRADGKVIWSKELGADFNGRLPLHGYSEAALIDGDKVFWTPGGKENNVVALNRFTGEVIWSHRGFGEAQGYNQPRLIRLPERNILVTFSSWHMMGFDTKTGEMLWSHEQDNLPVDKRKPGSGDTHSNTVIYENGFIWYQAGDGNCGVKLALSADGKSITELWRNPGFDGYMGGIVKIDDFIYGSGTAKPELRAVNALTGVLTDSLRLGAGALIWADEMLYYYTQKGDMVLLKYYAGKMEKISSFKITKGTKEHFSHPVINKGILYQRRGDAIMAFDIRNR
jgi:outer membrane protein assembly factor BamB